MLQVQIRQQAVQTANDAVYDAASQLLAQWDTAKLVKIQRGESGAITSMETDTAMLSRMQVQLNQLVQAQVQNASVHALRVPVGTLMGWSLLQERGPEVTVRFALSTATQCVLSNRFSEAGVNQTLHEVWLETEMTVYAMRPSGSRPETVKVSYCLAQTVIVGEVPSVALRN